MLNVSKIAEALATMAVLAGLMLFVFLVSSVNDPVPETRPTTSFDVVPGTLTLLHPTPDTVEIGR